MERDTAGRSRFSRAELLFGVLLLLGLAVAGWYIVSSNQKLGSRLDSVERATSSTQTRITVASTADTSTTVGSQFTFKGLGVAITLNNALKGLSYTASSPSSGYISTPELSAAYGGCSGAASNHSSLGLISKVNGMYSVTGSGGVVLMKQFPHFWLGYARVNGTICDDPAKNQAIVALSGPLNDALTQAFDNATIIR